MGIFSGIWNFVINHWAEIGVVLLALQNALKGIRDAIDTTPDTADNCFEKFVEIFCKASAYFFKAKRPEAK